MELTRNKERGGLKTLDYDRILTGFESYFRCLESGQYRMKEQKKRMKRERNLYDSEEEINEDNTI